MVENNLRVGTETAGFEGMLPDSRWRAFPSSPRRGGCAINKKLRSTLSRADGVVIIHNEILAELDHHPGRSIKEASR